MESKFYYIGEFYRPDIFFYMYLKQNGHFMWSKMNGCSCNESSHPRRAVFGFFRPAVSPSDELNGQSAAPKSHQHTLDPISHDSMTPWSWTLSIATVQSLSLSPSLPVYFIYFIYLFIRL